VTDFSAIVLDIDGTLLDSRSRLSSANLRALRECAHRNIALYVATARPRRLVFRPGEVDGDATFLAEKGVFYSGAVAVDQPLDYYAHWPMSAEVVSAVAGLLAEFAPDLQIAIQREDEYHSFRLPMTDEELASWGFPREELLPFSLASQQGASKIVAFHENLTLSALHHELVARHGREINAFQTDSGTWIPIVSRAASKERALLHLLAQRGTAPENVVVFGDDLPDAGMFATFGCSVAMGRAPEALKKAATHVTLSSDEDGVAHALKEILAII